MSTITAPPKATDLAEMLNMALEVAAAQSPRAQQTFLGPSSIGFCRQKAKLVTEQVPPSDAKAMRKAEIGTAIHKHYFEQLAPLFPDWLFEWGKVTAKLRSGVEITGTPDIVVPEWNTLLDLKTVDGLSWVKREGTSQNHKYQRFLYVLGCINAGLLNRDEQIHVGNIYVDRAGREAPYVLLEEMDWTLEDQVTQWIEDVIYAVEHKEDASRDIPAAVCQKICEFFTVCRGGLPASENELIHDAELLGAIQMAVEGKEMEKNGKRLVTDAKAMLEGVNGSDGTWQVRWTHVNGGATKPGFRAPYDKMEIVRVSGRG